ncbi:MAG: hypothetical protein JXO22_08350 [Phycisphaerae bacterium]|nr:hypothetical protein [Phycisphaerae bacterium]
MLPRKSRHAAHGAIENSQPDWPRLYERATAALRSAFQTRRELTHSQVADIVCGTLPPRFGRELSDQLRRRGWLLPRAHVPFDVLEPAKCPAAWRDGRREVVRLALFGLPGQGRPTEIKHREALYQQLCAQIKRESCDLPTLNAATARALSHPDAIADATLAGMLRSFADNREAELHVEAGERGNGDVDESQLRTAFRQDSSPTGGADLADIIINLERTRLEFEDHVRQYDELAARTALKRMADLCKRHQEVLSDSTLRDCKAEYTQLVARCDEFREQLAALADRAAEAAEAGDSVTATWALRRMAVIHALRPALLSDDRYAELRRHIEDSGEQEEYREAAARLVARERAVAADIRARAVIIRQFDHIARRLPATDEAYRRAQADFEHAAEELQTQNTEWIASLVIEMGALVEDMNDPTGRARNQVDNFIASVRESVLRLRREITTIRRRLANKPSS